MNENKENLSSNKCHFISNDAPANPLSQNRKDELPGSVFDYKACMLSTESTIRQNLKESASILQFKNSEHADLLKENKIKDANINKFWADPAAIDKKGDGRLVIERKQDNHHF